MIVMKFGGTSVGDAQRINNLVEIVKAEKERKPIVVVSALSKVTDLLIRAAKEALENKLLLNEIEERHYKLMQELGIEKELIRKEIEELRILLQSIMLSKELSKKQLDLIMSFGERMSVKIVAEYLSKKGIKAKPINAFEAGMITDSNFGNAEVLPEHEEKLRKFFSSLNEFTPIVTGFIGIDSFGEITTLGRGGSDYSAALIGAAVDAEEVQIWTDAHGIMSADPRVVPSAKTIPIVSYEEAAELAFLGAKVLHPKTISPAVRKNIPVKILNTFEPKHGGTIVLKEIKEKNRVASITCQKGLKVINIRSPNMFLSHGFLQRIFEAFGKHGVPVDILSTSEVNVSATVEKQFDLTEVIKELKQFSEVIEINNLAAVSVVGAGLNKTRGVASRIYSCLEEHEIEVIMSSAGATGINHSIVIREEKADEAIRLIHEKLFEKGELNEEN